MSIDRAEIVVGLVLAVALGAARWATAILFFTFSVAAIWPFVAVTITGVAIYRIVKRGIQK